MLVSEIKVLSSFAVELMISKAAKIKESGTTDIKFDFKKQWPLKLFGLDKPMVAKVYEMFGLPEETAFVTTYSDEYGNFAKNQVWGPKIANLKDAGLSLFIGLQTLPITVTPSRELEVTGLNGQKHTLSIIKQTFKNATGGSYTKLYASLFVEYVANGVTCDTTLEFPLIVAETGEQAQQAHQKVATAWSKNNAAIFEAALAELKVYELGGFTPDICDINKLMLPLIESNRFKPVTLAYNGYTRKESNINGAVVVKYYLNVDIKPLVDMFSDYEVQGFKEKLMVSDIKKIAVGASSVGAAPLALLPDTTTGLLMIQAPNPKNPKYAPRFTLIAGATHPQEVKQLPKSETKQLGPQIIDVESKEVEFTGF